VICTADCRMALRLSGLRVRVLRGLIAGWRCAYPAYGLRIPRRLIAGWRCAYPAYGYVFCAV